MKRAKKFLALCLGIAMAVGTFTPVTAKAEEVDWITAEDISDMPETTIRYWYYETPERIELGQKQVEEFMEMYPNIKVEGSIAPDNTDNEMLMTYVQSRTNSNIHQSANIEDLWYVDHGLLYPLNNFPDFEEQMARFDPDLNYTWVDGNTYSISWYNTPTVMFYNKKMMEEIGWDPANPPQTYSEYFEFAEKVTDPDQKRWAIAPWMGEEWWRWHLTVFPYYIAASGGNEMVSEDGKTATFNNQAMLDVYSFWEKLFDEGWAYKELWELDPFVTGQTASARGVTDLIKSIEGSAADDFEYVVGPIPVPDGTERGEFDTYCFVRNFCIMDELGAEEGEERDRVRRASWEFMKFLLSDEQCAADFEATGDLPCLVNPQENELLKPIFEKYGEGTAQLQEVGKNSTIFDMHSLYECDIQTPLQTAWLQMAYNGMSAQDALDYAEAEANKILAK